MILQETEQENLVPWKTYLYITFESVLSFYLATFSLAMFFTHQGLDHIFLSVCMVGFYLFILGVCVQRIIKTLSTAALMLVIPIAPLLALTVVVSLIPVLQLFI